MADSVAAFANEWLNWAQDKTHGVQKHLTVNNHGVKLTLPPKSFFKFPPADLPTTLPPPLEGPNLSNPFSIPTNLYNAALSPNVPITFALVYATVIVYLNSVNRERNQKPWAISRTALFKVFVLVHNIFLSVYSLWTFIGMVNALRVSLADPREYGLAATFDSLCKLNGPRGLGSAATYNTTTSNWGFTDRTLHLAKDGLSPDSSDVGRLWNEGLAFYGWLFYISKFYEVIDTLIIIAKGKQSSFLQVYHHFGAMLCMWAGIRYMSPPIWLFVTANSFIHFIMYSFYTAITLNIRVPKPLKKILTTLQISQFVIGVVYAFAHLFVAYRIPVALPYIYHLGDVARDVATSVKSDASSAIASATATASADLGSWLKKLALRAAGREGLAENVENQFGQTFDLDAVHAVEHFVHKNQTRREETRYRNDLQWVHCLDTSGQTFAICLNIFYLAPLTWLFIQFFIKSYLHRIDQRRRSSVGQKAYMAGQSIVDARKGVGRRLSEAFEDYQGADNELDGEPVVVDGKEIRKELRELANKTKSIGRQAADGAQNLAKKAQDGVQSLSETVGENTSGITESATEQVQKVSEQISEKSPVSTDDAQRIFEEMKDAAQKKAESAKEVLQQAMPSKDTQDTVKGKVGSAAQSAKKSVENLMSEETTSNATDTAEKVKEKADELSTDAVAKIKQVTGDGKEKMEGKARAGEDVVKESVKEPSGNGKKNGKNSAKEVTKESTKQSPSKGKGEGKGSAKEVTKENTKQSSGKGNAVEKGTPKPEKNKAVKGSANDKTSEPQSSGKSDVNQQAEDSAMVQQGKSFAEAAAEGVPEEQMGEVEVVDMESAESAIKEDDEDLSDSESDTLPDKISDAMSSNITDSPYSYLSRSQSSLYDPNLGSPTSSPKRQWHTKRRGRYWSGSGSGEKELDVKSSPTLSPVIYR